VTARCVLAKQNKRIMPLVGLVADGPGFYSAQYAKNTTKKPKKLFLGLVKILEGILYVDELEKDFGFHIPWGKIWKATKWHSGFLTQFPS
jgi:hypothetical protein